MALQLTNEDLQHAAEKGEKAAAAALSVMSKLDVRVSTKQQRVLTQDKTDTATDLVAPDTISAYTQAITGLTGTSVLTMVRKDALTLVDLFNGREPGSTVVMNELDRSTIKETLNILSNSYIVELAKLKDTSILLSVPRMVTKGSIDGVIEGVKENATQVLFFETSMEVQGADFQVALSFYFLTGD